MSSAKDTMDVVSFLIKNRGPQKLTDVGNTLGINNSTIHRMLTSLKSTEWVIQDPETKKYNVGTRLLEVALSLTSQMTLKDVSLPLLRSVHSRIERVGYVERSCRARNGFT